MSTDYTPTTDDARDRYADARVGVGEWTRFDESVKRAVEDAYAEFDRWLAQVKAEAFEAGVRSAVDAVNSTPPSNLKPYLRGAEQ